MFGLILTLLLMQSEGHAGGIIHSAGSTLYITDEKGHTRKIADNLYRGYVGTFGGETRPVLSPDASMAAYVSTDSNVHLVQTGSMRKKQVSLDGAAETRKYSQVLALISAWSPDGTKLLYSQMFVHPMGDGPFSTDGFERPGISTGFLVYDVKAETRTALPAVRKFDFWAPDSRGLIFSEFKDGKLHFRRLDLASRELEDWAELPQIHLAQMSVSPDGSRIVFSELDSSNHSGRIRIFNRNEKRFEEVSPLGGFAEHQWPAFSPMSDRIAYVRYPTPGNTLEQEWVIFNVAEGREQFRLPVRIRGQHRFRWLDNDHVGSTTLEGRAVVADIKKRTISEYGVRKAP